MVFTENEILIIKMFCQSILDNLLPIDNQENVLKDNKVWCCDFDAIEDCTCLFRGVTDYLVDPLPDSLIFLKKGVRSQILS